MNLAVGLVLLFVFLPHWLAVVFMLLMVGAERRKGTWR